MTSANYYVNSSRLASLTIGGTDYSSNLVSWKVSDASLNSNGLMTTSGTLELSPLQGGEGGFGGYDRKKFKRGTVVTLDVRHPDGTVVRHPRGYLYTFSSSYNVESETIVVDIGCQLALAALTDDVTQLLPLVPMPLDVLQRTLQGVSASFATAGKYLYQDNTGALVEGVFFDGDTTTSSAPGDWVSVLGRSALSAQPLVGSGGVPDEINLSYAYPASFSTTDNRLDIVTTESEYFLNYPATIYTRTGTSLNDLTGVSSGTVIDAGTTSACGNTPPPPAASQQTPSCNEGYVLSQSPLVLPASRVTVQRTEYEGPAGQVSRVYTSTRGPAVEANGQYFSDAFAYCRYTWATRCQPNGACSTDDGMEDILLGYSEESKIYGSSGELIGTVTDTYATTLSAAQPFDWRSGVVDGVPQNYTPLSTTTMYRVSRVTQDFRQENNANIQETTTYTSVATNGTGINKGNIDALAGVRTFERRTSTTISTLPLAPDTTVTPQTQTSTAQTVIRMESSAYLSPPAESGPLILRTQAPIPFLLDSKAETDTAVQVYGDYLARWSRGSVYGLQIGEALREDIVTNWRPGMPFRYVDDRPGLSNDSVLALRMDACQWGVTQSEAAVAMNGVFVGYSDGTLSRGNNLKGNSEAQLNGSTPPASLNPTVDDTIVGETAVTTGGLHFTIKNDLMIKRSTRSMYPLGVALKAPRRTDSEAKLTMTCWVQGFVAAPGSLVAPTENGTPLATNNGLLQTDSTVLVDADVFS